MPSNTIESEKDDTVSAPDISRIINLEKLTEFIKYFQPARYNVRRLCLLKMNPKSRLKGKESSKKVVRSKGIKRWECILAAVWGQMATGGGHSRLSETIGIVGVPTMSQKISLKQRGSSGNDGSKN